ncbi:16512_t:CDS:1 [Cetraspora pellucida]|uniref:16512_t:CDS:1 n=1 Tax=Cetraspora pellucida TaxID=1433469 RepID=A0A9N9EPJ8_9GLOM|nr:16512_t:CDS:1 [Cetraspora pellucida]
MSIGLFFLGINFFICAISPSFALWQFIEEASSNEDQNFTTIRDNMIRNNKRKVGLIMTILHLLLAITSLLCATVGIVFEKMPETTFPGLITTSISLLITLFLWLTIRYLARKLGSSTVLSEARYSLICLEITAVIFLSSLLYLILPNIWWLDSAATLILGTLLIIECSIKIYVSKRNSDKANGNNCRITITVEETTSSQNNSFRKSFNSSKRPSSKLSTKVNERQNKRPGSFDLLDIPIETKPIDIEMLR